MGNAIMDVILIYKCRYYVPYLFMIIKYETVIAFISRPHLIYSVDTSVQVLWHRLVQKMGNEDITFVVQKYYMLETEQNYRGLPTDDRQMDKL